MKKKGSPVVRFVGLAILIGGAAFLLASPIQEARQERRVRALLLEVQEGLQNYHISEELYPKQPMKGKELVSLLVELEFLDASTTNPWTGTAYLDSEDSDWLRYSTGSLAETYELVVTYPESEEVQFRLDSTENQSLE